MQRLCAKEQFIRYAVHIKGLRIRLFDCKIDDWPREVPNV